MTRSNWLMALAAALAIMVTQAPLAQAQNSQQSKMGTCNADASSKNFTWR